MEGMDCTRLTNATEWLEQVLQEKIRKNPSYSLRAFSKMVSVSPSYLSRILSHQRSLNFKTALKICEALAYGPVQKEQIITLVKKESAKPIHKDECKQEESHMSLTVDAFAAVSDWYHYGITQLFFTENFSIRT